jgi:hypothetical protein
MTHPLDTITRITSCRIWDRIGRPNGRCYARCPPEWWLKYGIRDDQFRSSPAARAPSASRRKQHRGTA